MKKTFELNDDQKSVLASLNVFFNDSSNTMALLEGCAGSGKSTTVSFFIDDVLEKGLFGKVAIVAPTNKAVKVIKEMIDEELRAKIDFSSLHSLLGLKHQITKDGKEIYKRDEKSICRLSFYDLVIVDEASMVADELFNELENQNYRGTKILFVGDSNQINPVNHKHSIPMLKEKRDLFNIEHYKLTKVVRQAEGNPIIAYSQKVITGDFTFKPGTNERVDNMGVVMFPQDQKEVLMALLKHYFCTEEFDKNANFCKFIAWRNVTVDQFNNIIRAMKYGNRTPKIVVGEKLLVDRPIVNDEGGILFTTNEDLEVLAIEEGSKTLYEQEYKFYKCKVKGDVTIDDITILHERYESLYTKNLKALAEDAAKEPDVTKRISKWRKYFGFMENFAHVKYNYAITAHNSQGSTYTNTFVMYSDINLNYREDEKKRILYTALTRPKEMLYIL